MGAYFEMFKRDRSRMHDIYERMNYCPLGSGALAGTTYPLDREYTAELLGFYGPTLNSMDGVSDRDYLIEYLSAMATIMMHLSRFSEEIIIWNSNEYKFVEIDDAYSTGSSIMPQKKNPDIAELVRGKTGRVYGALMSLLTTMKGIPLAYNKDMQEDKELSFDAIDTTKGCIALFTGMKFLMYLGAVLGFIVSQAEIPFIVVRSDISAPYTRPVLPRTSSAISGFFFCGMILLPVLYASSISTNLYSLEFQMMISSEKRLKCIIMVAMADRYSIR